MIMKIPNEIKEAINDLAIYILEANKARHKIVTWLRNEMHISDIPFYNRVFPIFRFRFSTVNDITNTIYKCIEGGIVMKQTIDAIMQIATLIMGIICFVIGIINIKEATEYLAISMALVSASLLFSRIQDKEERK